MNFTLLKSFNFRNSNRKIKKASNYDNNLEEISSPIIVQFQFATGAFWTYDVTLSQAELAPYKIIFITIIINTENVFTPLSERLNIAG